MSDQRTGQADTAPQAHIDAVADHVHELIPDQWLIDEFVRRGVLTEQTTGHYSFSDDDLRWVSERRLVTEWEPTP